MLELVFCSECSEQRAGRWPGGCPSQHVLSDDRLRMAGVDRVLTRSVVDRRGPFPGGSDSPYP